MVDLKEKLDIIIPVSIDLDWPKVPEVIEEIREQHRQSNILPQRV